MLNYTKKGYKMERKTFDNPKELLKERQQILEDTVRGNNPKSCLLYTSGTDSC